MGLGENLLNYRREHGMSQEDLAEALQVSRQSIYKWESGQSLPEVEKLILISELLGCSLDDLVKRDVNFENQDFKRLCLKHYHRFSFAIGLGVFIVLFGVASFMLLIEVLESNPTLPVVVLLIHVIVAVVLFIYFGIGYDHFEKENKDRMGDVIFTSDEKSRFMKRFGLMYSLAVALVLIGVILIIVFSNELQKQNLWPLSLMLFLIGAAGYLFTRYGILLEAYENADKVLQKKEKKEKRRETIASKANAVVMLIATMVFLVLGFVWSLWHPGWVAFVVGGLVCGIISVIYSDDVD